MLESSRQIIRSPWDIITSNTFTDMPRTTPQYARRLSRAALIIIGISVTSLVRRLHFQLLQFMEYGYCRSGRSSGKNDRRPT